MWLRWSGICFGSSSVWNATYFAEPSGSTRFTKSASGKPSQGMTMLHASTQRIR